ncbi:hypothetical protein [Uliginosibacterium sp. 31-12]|uniref:hypothetical protein n=1 Tax=Uliginosibacterium sp. 31-12 TaxID=3062781 RepID=UPI0026E4332B|nr:hypothetical protein [Uliginosibacterium sp. 31-12]MDO6385507.1 hypothetical protein [Uliginosibacterium sp. 31-12]
MASEYRVVFKGEILDGFDPEAVRIKASAKLKASPEQVERLFSGRSSVLKKGIAADVAERYVKELGKIGMRVKLEAVAEAARTPPPTPVVQAFSDLEKTQLADPLALSRYLQGEQDAASAPTVIVTPAQQQEVLDAVASMGAANAPTLIVTPALRAGLLAEHAPSAADMPTVIVNPAPGGSTPGMVVREEKTSPPRHDPERTLIANPAALDAYFKTESSAQPAAAPTQSQFPTGVPLDPHKTELNPDALDAYLSAHPQPPAITKPAPLREVTVSVAKDFNTGSGDQAISVFAPSMPSGPFAAATSPTQWMETEQDEDLAPPPDHAATRLRKIKIGAAVTLAFLLLWWLL